MQVDIQKKIQEEKAKGKPNTAVIKEYENQIQIINGVADAYKRLTEEEMLAVVKEWNTMELDN